MGDNYMSMFDWNSPMRNVQQQTSDATSLVPGMNWGKQSPVMSNQAPTNVGDEGGGMFSSMLGENGWGGLALGGANSLMKGWLGMEQLDMAKDRLEENKRQFDMNWGAQKKMTNSRLEDRQRRRNSAGGNATDTGKYMDKWGVK